MSNLKKDTIEAKGFSIQVYTEDFKNDYISLTDITMEFASWISLEKFNISFEYDELENAFVVYGYK